MSEKKAHHYNEFYADPERMRDKQYSGLYVISHMTPVMVDGCHTRDGFRYASKKHWFCSFQKYVAKWRPDRTITVSQAWLNGAFLLWCLVWDVVPVVAKGSEMDHRWWSGQFGFRILCLNKELWEDWIKSDSNIQAWRLACDKYSFVRYEGNNYRPLTLLGVDPTKPKKEGQVADTTPQQHFCERVNQVAEAKIVEIKKTSDAEIQERIETEIKAKKVIAIDGVRRIQQKAVDNAVLGQEFSPASLKKAIDDINAVELD